MDSGQVQTSPFDDDDKLLDRWRKIKTHRYLLHLAVGNSFRQRAPFTAGTEQTKVSRCKRGCIILYSTLTSHLGLLLILIAYSFIGAAVFQAVEGRTGRKSDDAIMTKQRERVVDTLLNDLLSDGLVDQTDSNAVQVKNSVLLILTPLTSRSF